MKTAGLLIGILLMGVCFIVFVICLALPSMTNNRINFQESLVGLIASALIGLLAFILTVVSAVSVFKKKRGGEINPAQRGQV